VGDADADAVAEGLFDIVAELDSDTLGVAVTVDVAESLTDEDSLMDGVEDVELLSLADDVGVVVPDSLTDAV
jgi:hypothetical protein